MNIVMLMDGAGKIAMAVLVGALFFSGCLLIVLVIIWLVMAAAAWLIENWRENKVQIICYPIAAILLLLVFELTGATIINHMGGWDAFISYPKPVNVDVSGCNQPTLLKP